MRRVMVQGVQRRYAYEAHGKRLLRDRAGDAVLLDPSQRWLVGVHRHDYLAANLVSVEHIGHLRAGDGLQANESIDLVDDLLVHQLLSVIKSDARIASDIDGFHDLDSQVAFKAVVVAMQAVLQIGLLWHGKNHHVAFALQLRHGHLSAHQTRSVIVGSYEGQPLARGRVGIDRDYRDALSNRGIDIRLDHRGIRY